jgi:dTDP-glucose 4,6-dehydratase
MTAWLITGGAGIIGANFVRVATAGAADTIVVLDALTYAGNFANIADVVDDRRVRFHKGDICDAALVGELFATYRGAAGLSGGGRRARPRSRNVRQTDPAFEG